jgi:thiol-disulfide isomerase/thioredoxin
MKRVLRQVALLSVVAAAAVGCWFVFPGPFVHGIIVGVFGGLGSIVVGFTILMRRLKKRMEVNLAPPPLPTGSWDYSIELEELAGNRVTGTEFKGDVLILNFWATWCAPCVAEMPSLIRLHEAAADLGVKMVCVTNEPREVVSKFVEKRGLTAPIYLLAEDPPEQFKSRSIPATFILDKNGMIALRHTGAATWDDNSVVTFVRGLAATPKT